MTTFCIFTFWGGRTNAFWAISAEPICPDPICLFIIVVVLCELIMKLEVRILNFDEEFDFDSGFA